MLPAKHIDLPAIKKLSWSITTSYNVSQVISCNLALGASGTNLPLVYEGHPNFRALPTFGTVHGIAVMGLVHRAMSDFLPNFQGHNHVHGEHYLKLSRPYPIPKGTQEVNLTTTAKVVDIQLDRGTRSSLHPTPQRAPDRILVLKTSPEQAALYRAASGDLNPLHIDSATAEAAGFLAPLLTGTCTLGIGVRHVVEAFAEGDVGKFKSVKVRLSKPVFAALSEEMRTEMWRDGGRVLFRMVVGGGKEEKVVMSQGAVELGEGAKL
ncbi:Nn.00g107760.m01.CDS01 [Neocucurbitaria sp. VM-36]